LDLLPAGLAHPPAKLWIADEDLDRVNSPDPELQLLPDTVGGEYRKAQP